MEQSVQWPAAMGHGSVFEAFSILLEEADLCIKLIDRDGVIEAANARGLSIVGTTRDAFCDHVWYTFWSDAQGELLRLACAQAFDGRPQRLQLQSGDGRLWAIDLRPLMEYGSSAPDRILAISRLVSERPSAPKPYEGRLREVEHELAKLMSVAGSVSRQLRDGTASPERQSDLSEALIGSFESAMSALEMLRNMQADRAPLAAATQ